MAITDQHSHVIAGMATAADEQAERETTRKVADRYRKEFIDLREQRIDPELFRTIPADLMFRYNFVPLEVQNNLLSIAVADPSQVLLSDELSLLLGKKLHIKVATLRQISDLLKRTEQSQRVLEQATEAFTLQIGKDEDRERRDDLRRPPDAGYRRRARWFDWSRPSSLPRWSGARAIFTSKRATPKWRSSTASTAFCSTPCSRSRRNGIRRCCRASRC